MPSPLKLQTRKAKLGPFNAPSAREDTRSQSSKEVGLHSLGARSYKLVTRSGLLNIRTELLQQSLTKFVLKRQSRSLVLHLATHGSSPFP